MKLGKEIKSNNFKNYSVAFGCINNKQAKSVYINISSWGEPTEDFSENVNRVVRNLNKRVKQHLFNLIETKYVNEFNKDEIIIVFDLKESGIRCGKRSFMSCEINLFSKIEMPVHSERMKFILNEISKNLIENVFEKLSEFKFNKRKK
jgi:hypothetical protein